MLHAFLWFFGWQSILISLVVMAGMGIYAAIYHLRTQKPGGVDALWGWSVGLYFLGAFIGWLVGWLSAPPQTVNLGHGIYLQIISSRPYDEVFFRWIQNAIIWGRWIGFGLGLVIGHRVVRQR